MSRSLAVATRRATNGELESPPNSLFRDVYKEACGESFPRSSPLRPPSDLDAVFHDEEAAFEPQPHASLLRATLTFRRELSSALDPVVHPFVRDGPLPSKKNLQDDKAATCPEPSAEFHALHENARPASNSVPDNEIDPSKGFAPRSDPTQSVPYSNHRTTVYKRNSKGKLRRFDAVGNELPIIDPLVLSFPQLAMDQPEAGPHGSNFSTLSTTQENPASLYADFLSNGTETTSAAIAKDETTTTGGSRSIGQTDPSYQPGELGYIDVDYIASPSSPLPSYSQPIQRYARSEELLVENESEQSSVNPKTPAPPRPYFGKPALNLLAPSDLFGMTQPSPGPAGIALPSSSRPSPDLFNLGQIPEEPTSSPLLRRHMEPTGSLHNQIEISSSPPVTSLHRSSSIPRSSKLGLPAVVSSFSTGHSMRRAIPEPQNTYMSRKASQELKRHKSSDVDEAGSQSSHDSGFSDNEIHRRRRAEARRKKGSKILQDVISSRPRSGEEDDVEVPSTANGRRRRSSADEYLAQCEGKDATDSQGMEIEEMVADSQGDAQMANDSETEDEEGQYKVPEAGLEPSTTLPQPSWPTAAAEAPPITLLTAHSIHEELEADSKGLKIVNQDRKDTNNETRTILNNIGSPKSSQRGGSAGPSAIPALEPHAGYYPTSSDKGASPQSDIMPPMRDDTGAVYSGTTHSTQKPTRLSGELAIVYETSPLGSASVQRPTFLGIEVDSQSTSIVVDTGGLGFSQTDQEVAESALLRSSPIPANIRRPRRRYGTQPRPIIESSSGLSIEHKNKEVGEIEEPTQTGKADTNRSEQPSEYATAPDHLSSIETPVAKHSVETCVIPPVIQEEDGHDVIMENSPAPVPAASRRGRRRPAPKSSRIVESSSSGEPMINKQTSKTAKPSLGRSKKQLKDVSVPEQTSGVNHSVATNSGLAIEHDNEPGEGAKITLPAPITERDDSSQLSSLNGMVTPDEPFSVTRSFVNEAEMAETEAVNSNVEDDDDGVVGAIGMHGIEHMQTKSGIGKVSKETHPFTSSAKNETTRPGLRRKEKLRKSMRAQEVAAENRENVVASNPVIVPADITSKPTSRRNAGNTTVANTPNTATNLLHIEAKSKGSSLTSSPDALAISPRSVRASVRAVDNQVSSTLIRTKPARGTCAKRSPTNGTSIASEATLPSEPSKNSVRASSTEPTRDGTPASTRARSTSVRADEQKLFTNMAFAVSYSFDTARNALLKIIKTNGGRVLHNGFDELFEPSSTVLPSGASPPNDDSNTKEPVLRPSSYTLGFVCLIADVHSRKAKYMQALALDLPCIYGNWIEHCSLKNEVLDWGPYLLAAGNSHFLGGAVRSRSLTPYPATTAKFHEVFEKRRKMLVGKSILLVIGKGKPEERKKAYYFLTQVLGAHCVKRVLNELDARRLLLESEGDGKIWDCVYVDAEPDKAEETIFGSPSVSPGKKRKRASGARDNVAEISGRAPKKVKVIGDEFVIQSLILGQLMDE